MVPAEGSPGGRGDAAGDGGFLLLRGPDSGSVRKGCDPFAQTQRSKLQHRRARINQQINKEMRMRAGAENLFKATSNHKVKETVALELSYVNSNLQLLKEELEELNSCVDVYQNDSESISVPMIPLGLKETKEMDLMAPLKDLICEHYGEDGISFEKEIKELMELRQAMRTPSRNEAGLELLMEYYNQLYFLDNRFFPPNKNLGIFFHWYDSLTGVPSHQRALAFEKGSVLFNIGALHTQIGARQDRTTLQGVDRAIDAFQKAAAVSEADFPEHEKAFVQFHVTMPEGPSLRLVLQDPEERRKLGKAHLKKAIMRHEEAMRIHSLCKILRKMDILQEVLSFAHKRSLSKYSEIDHEEDFFETGDASDIHPKTNQRPEIKSPNFSQVKVTDIFHRLGPLSVFSAKNKWCPARRVHLARGENGFGLTLRGDSPVLIAGVIPGGCASEAGLKEGDYIVSVNSEDCKWSKHAEVVQLLKSVREEGVDIGVVTLQSSSGQTVVDRRLVAMSSGGALLKNNKENSRKSLMNSKSASTLLAWSKKSKRSKSSTYSLPFTTVGDESMY
ncbi:rhophilin-1 isoform X3 [Chelonoidis abingdonii]|uniref:rhophilin-1 isoform X3 n=1 Tax=Chelonoidis abingdonii TaxID=106734 RepID=UPI0013F18FC4|nr:rhophilin-1 isoform X3 [Chelonoidis abingdonii]